MVEDWDPMDRTDPLTLPSGGLNIQSKHTCQVINEMIYMKKTNLITHNTLAR